VKDDNLPMVSPQAGRDLAEGSLARVREAYEHFAEAGEMALNAFETNVRASLDFAERLAKAADAREMAALHVTFMQEQSRRLTDQMVDLHQTTSRLAREAASRTETP
jgi:hypothetical protein